MNNMIANIRTQLQKLKCRIANLTKRVAYIEDNCCNGGGGGDMPDVSATERGVVNNEPLQELGGVDKLINGVRIGRGSGNNEDNLIVGKDTLSTNTTGTYNTAFGGWALTENTTGSFNSSFGSGALYSNTTGIYNNAFGTSTLQNNTTGSRNVGVGTSLFWNSTGQENTGVGFNAGYGATTGSQNTYIGNQAGYNNGIGSYNTAIGSRAMITSGTGIPASALDMNRNVFIGAGLTLADGVNDVLAIDNKGATNTFYSNALLYGNFADRFLRINGRFEIAPSTMPVADSTYTKKLVWNPTTGIVAETDDTDGTGIQSIQEGDNISIDNTDPQNPIISALGGGGGTSDDISNESTVTGATVTEALDELQEQFDVKVDSLEQQIANVADGTAGKAYPDLTTAMSVTPLPDNGVIFTIDEDNETEAGVYAYDSNEVNGYRFVRELGAKGKVEEGNTQAVSGGEVYDYTNNELALKAFHGYESNPKTLKEVEDSILDIDTTVGDVVDNIYDINTTVDMPNIIDYSKVIDLYKTPNDLSDKLRWVKYNGDEKIESLAIYAPRASLHRLNVVLNGTVTNHIISPLKQGLAKYVLGDFDVWIDSTFINHKSNDYTDKYLKIPLITNSLYADKIKLNNQGLELKSIETETEKVKNIDSVYNIGVQVDMPNLYVLDKMVDLYKTPNNQSDKLHWIKYNGEENIDSLLIFAPLLTTPNIRIVCNGIETTYEFLADSQIEGIGKYTCGDFDIWLSKDFFNYKTNNPSDKHIKLPLVTNSLYAQKLIFDFFNENYGEDLQKAYSNLYPEPFFSDDAKVFKANDVANLMVGSQNTNTLFGKPSFESLSDEIMGDIRAWDIRGALYSYKIQIPNASDFVGKYFYIGFYHKETTGFELAIKGGNNNNYHGGNPYLREGIKQNLTDTLSYTSYCVKITPDKFIFEDNMITVLFFNSSPSSKMLLTGLKILFLDKDISHLIRPTTTDDSIIHREKPLDYIEELDVREVKGNASFRQLELKPSGQLPHNSVGFYYNGTDVILQMKDKKYKLLTTEL